MKKINYLIVSLFLFCSVAEAKNMGLDKPNLRADHVKFNYKSGMGHYTGNVKVWNAQTSITGKEMFVTTNPKSKHEIKKIVIIGHPAKCHAKEDDKTIIAYADEITFNPKKQSLTLKRNAEIHYSGHIVKSPLLVYHILEQRLLSSSNKNQNTKFFLNAGNIFQENL